MVIKGWMSPWSYTEDPYDEDVTGVDFYIENTEDDSNRGATLVEGSDGNDYLVVSRDEIYAKGSMCNDDVHFRVYPITNRTSLDKVLIDFDEMKNEASDQANQSNV
tara:strand:- start:629 stop:946 length:318 start_codon:yes stop_codon:yes gene_type:complete